MELISPIDLRPKQLGKNITCGVAYIRVAYLRKQFNYSNYITWETGLTLGCIEKNAELTVEVVNELLKSLIN